VSSSRRTFLRTVAAAPAVAAVPADALPTVEFAGRRITKLIIGSDPFYGYGHAVPMLDRFLREHYTADRRLETVRHAAACGIDTWQTSWSDAGEADWTRYREEGGAMNVLLLADGVAMKDLSLLPKIAKRLRPIGIAHHGNRTDDRFREGRMGLVQDFVKAVHDAGLPAGVSCHNPEVVRYIEERGWDNDYYMTCLYRVSRSQAETRAHLGEAPLGEPFLERDPERMTETIRATKKTCFAFKLLGAGRNTRSPAAIESAFRYALSRIKPQDAVIVGMSTKFTDEVRHNADLVRRILAS
jgi:hypothetical protein